MARKRKPSTVQPVNMMGDESWRARGDLDTLSRAEEIKGDKKRLAAARAEAKRQMKGLSSIAGDERQQRRERLEDVEL